MNRYLIFCCPGSGGMFLSSILAKILGYDIKSQVSSTGNVHDIGQGVWTSIEPCICLIGDFWELNYRPNQLIYYSHVFNRNFWQNNPDVSIIKIQADPSDYRKVAELYVKKAWPDIWTEEEYNKWVGPDYPPYSRTNIPDSELICNDLINDIEITNIKKWHDENLTITNCTTINFKTIMGIDQDDLVDTICDIIKLPATDAIRRYVAEYQKINQMLYFKNYV